MDRRVLAALLILAFLIPAVPATGQYYSGELILRVGMQDDMKGTNPLTVSDVWSWQVLQWLYDRPTLVNQGTGELMPYIAIGSANVSGKAESWADCTVGNFGYSPASSWQDSGKQEAIIFYDFENVRWHDGTQMTVRDVMFSYHLAAQVPEWGATGDMAALKDMGGSWYGNYSRTSWLHIYEVWEDGHRAALRFQLQVPYEGFFKSTVSRLLLPYHIWGSIVSGQNVDNARIWCDPGYNASAADSWKVAAAQSFENNPPIGSGIMKFEFWNKGQLSKITTFRDHFFRGDYKYIAHVGTDEYNRSLVRQPNIDAIIYRIYKTAETAVLALKNNDIDYIAWSIPPSFVHELETTPGIVIHSLPESGFFYMAYNMRKPSFGYNASGEDVGKPLRRAISHCIDKDRIVTRLLLNLGSPGVGPVPPHSEWFNASVPTYDFDPGKAKEILADAGYGVKIGGVGDPVSGQAAIDAAGPGNWWVNPDGTNIGSAAGGKIEILTPEANYDPIRAQAGLMMAQQFRDIGIYAESVAMDFGSIVDRIDNRVFEMYILGWNLMEGDPADYLYQFYHSGNAAIGQNYPGYRNASYDALIDLARSTGDPDVRKKAIFDAQAAICYDLPVDVLYYRRSIKAVRTDRLVGWVDRGGEIFHRDSLVNLRGPYLHTLSVKFVGTPSAVFSNSTTLISVLAVSDDGSPMSGTAVKMDSSVGSLSAYSGLTGSAGRFTTEFTAPHVPSTPENMNGTMALIQVISATCPDPEHSPAQPRFILVTVYPEGARFLSVSLAADPDVIDDYTGVKGFTFVYAEVRDQDGMAVEGALVNLSAEGSWLTISPREAATDADGRAQFTVTSADLPNDDGSSNTLTLAAAVTHPEHSMTYRSNVWITVVDVRYRWPPPPPPPPEFPVATAAATMAAIMVVGAIYIFMKRRGRE